MQFLQKIFSRRRTTLEFPPAMQRTSPDGIRYIFQYAPHDDNVAVGFSFKGGYFDDAAGSPPAALGISQALIRQAFLPPSPLKEDDFVDRGGAFYLDPEPFSIKGGLAAPLKAIDKIAQFSSRFLCCSDFAEEAVIAGRESGADWIVHQQSVPLRRNFNSLVEMALQPGPYFSPARLDVADMRSVTADDLLEWRDRHFSRSRLTACLVGRLDASAADSVIDAIFSRLKVGSTVDVLMPPLAPFVGARQLRCDGNEVQAALTVASIEARKSSPVEYLAASLFAYIIGGDEQSRLFKEVRDHFGAAYDLTCSSNINAESISFSIDGMVDRNSCDDVLECIRRIVGQLAEAGPTYEEVCRAKKAFGLSYSRILMDHHSAAREVVQLTEAGWSLSAINDVRNLAELTDLASNRHLLEPLCASPFVVIDA
ncbi:MULTISPECIES: M16 family metallopeptidase [unclassified Ensifer]|uniref:M16 family metallopeptidase n=1 Tax=unclassified Ensifer TaxID=2633371 RepID=UPI00300FC7A6